jgi:hypothetical protein
MLSPNKKMLIKQLLEFPDVNDNYHLLKEKEMIINQIKTPVFI